MWLQLLSRGIWWGIVTKLTTAGGADAGSGINKLSLPPSACPLSSHQNTTTGLVHDAAGRAQEEERLWLWLRNIPVLDSGICSTMVSSLLSDLLRT
jgi:hypothetical protein